MSPPRRSRKLAGKLRRRRLVVDLTRAQHASLRTEADRAGVPLTRIVRALLGYMLTSPNMVRDRIYDAADVDRKNGPRIK